MLLGMYSGDLGFSVSIPNFIKVAESDTHREKYRETERVREQICITGTDVFSICFRK